jgi:hypothetical protein
MALLEDRGNSGGAALDTTTGVGALRRTFGSATGASFVATRAASGSVATSSDTGTEVREPGSTEIGCVVDE